MEEVAAANPEVNFAIVDDASLADVPNVASLTFAEEQGSYLVGVAAGKKTKTNKVGFIGGVNIPLIQKFQAGFEAGVKAANPAATVTAKYITEPPDFAGFNSPQQGETIATGMYNDGIDIIYAAAGGSGAGVFKAAKATGNLGIGVDSDQYNSPTLADVKDVIMTSMLKKVDVATYDFITSAVNGEVAHRRAQVRPEQRRRRLLHLRRPGRRHRSRSGDGQGGDHRRHDHRSDDRPADHVTEADHDRSDSRPRREFPSGPRHFC